MIAEASYWIDRLRLSPHPEGGFFRQTYLADLAIPKAALPDRFHGDRRASTAIYFLLDGENFSAFHRIASDELWHFYAGSGLLVHCLQRDGTLFSLAIGNDAEAGEEFQGVVPAGTWFGSELKDPSSYALVGCTVAPGFDFADFEMAKRDELSAAYPQHAALIRRLTRD